jgi:1-deoxy-D-xylulose-5-phosphate reductoisomerase
VAGKKRVAVLGATGSIGKSALDVIEKGRDDFDIVLLTAHCDRAGLEKAGMAWPDAAKVLSGSAGRQKLLDAIAACRADVVVNGICGAAGLEPSMAAIEAGADLALANKETLVMAGGLVTQRAREKKKRILPVDSEHSAVFALIAAHAPGFAGCELSVQAPETVEEIILTASGGPFRDKTMEEMAKATAKDALAHPTWNMGAKISIDSATMANKGLEVIEAARLFGFPPERIKVTVHRQSIVHSMIRMRDGAVYAQLSRPDMRHPIHQALYPGMVKKADFGRLDFDNLSLDFCRPDTQRFPLLGLAYLAAQKGGLYPCAYNAANEVAVDAFLAGRIGFLDIAGITDYILGRDWSADPETLPAVMEADRLARSMANKEIH